jgi:hypothetical protein
MADPVFILAPGRTFTSVICGMLGQHPQMYGLPELYLNLADTMRDWWIKCGAGRTALHHGLVRTVAQLYCGAQTEETVSEAYQWIRQHFRIGTDGVFRLLAEQLEPRIAVEKSPYSVTRDENLARLLRFFPSARFIHLVRHPRATCASLLKFENAVRLLSRSNIAYDFSTNPPTLDPQVWWHENHLRIKSFTESLPTSQWLRLQGERFLMGPQEHLRRVTVWLGLRCDDAALARMMHPEGSPFARFGPPSAPFGNDHDFLQSPEFRPFRDKGETLDDALEWRSDGCGFLPEVKDLARELGYR